MKHVFLNFVAQQFVERKRNWNNTIIVFPTQRAAFLFKNALISFLPKPAILPIITTVENWVDQHTSRSTQKSALMLWNLYRAFQKHIGQEITWVQFLKWGAPLLSDMSEIDAHLVDPHQLFNQLETEKKIEVWAKKLGEEVVDELNVEKQKSYLQFYKNLEQVYHEFQQLNSELGWGTKGSILKEIASQQSMIEKAQVWMVGFSAITKSEEQIWMHVAHQNGLEAFFHVEDWMLQPHQESGLFFHQYHKDRPWWKKENIFNHCVPQSLILNAAVNPIHQVKLVSQQIQLWLENGVQPEQIGVVLCDENLLTPLLESMPKSFGPVNVSMGYSVSESLIFSAVKRWDWFLSRVKGRDGQVFLSELQSLVTTGAWKRQFGFSFQQKLKEYRVKGYQRIQKGNWEELLPLANEPHVMHAATTIPSNWEQLSKTILLLAQIWKSSFDEDHREYLASVFLIDAIQSINSFLQETNAQVSWAEGLQWLVMEWGKERIPLEGTRTEGIQVMGLLESRSLDFEKLIVLSANEGILPAMHQPNYFVPLRLKELFKMRRREESDAVAAYLFYRAIATPSEVQVFYATISDYGVGGEMSRFLAQIEIERKKYRPNDSIMEVKHGFSSQLPVSMVQKQALKLKKEPAILKQMLVKWTTERNSKNDLSGISPSVINSYWHHPWSFYERYMLGFDSNNSEPEDFLNPRLVGVLFHYSVEYLYEHVENQLLNVSIIKQMKAALSASMQKAMQSEELKNRPIDTGRNHLLISLAELYLKAWLAFEQKRLEGGSEVHIIGIEKTYQAQRKILVNKVDVDFYFLGKFDRIEKCDGVLRIVDFKSGSFKASELKVSKKKLLAWDVEAIIPSKSFQLLFYAWVLLQQPEFLSYDEIELAIVPLQKVMINPIENLWIEVDSKNKYSKISKADLELFFENAILPSIQDLLNEDSDIVIEVENMGFGMIPD